MHRSTRYRRNLSQEKKAAHLARRREIRKPLTLEQKLKRAAGSRRYRKNHPYSELPIQERNRRAAKQRQRLKNPENWEKHLSSVSIYRYNRQARDPGFKKLYQLRRTLVYLLRHRPKKSKWALQNLGCTIEFFLSYIERQFRSGMTWDNYGKGGWKIDHILPCRLFDFTDQKDITRCFHFTNLRPLWAAANRKQLNQERLGLLT